ncbi:MAG: EVE domain-containing protein [Saprospiraceae bacterium]|jgi:predicted RNA-binding protein with PUA-like domain|nr:EVE domain-containing protein [Saprospiraceae bacterium]
MYWLVKSEPYEYSFEDLIRDGSTVWSGVRNYAARNHLRNMRQDDFVLYYHSRKGLEIVGIAKVQKESYPDPTAEKEDWSAVDLVPVKYLAKAVSLKTIKARPELAEMPLVKIGRLSVMPLTAEEFETILELGETNMY